MGLSDARLVGGGLTVGFGRFVHLGAGYGRSTSALSTSLTDADYLAGVLESENTIDTELLRTDVRVRLGDWRVAPMLLGGGGVLGLSPSGRPSVQQVFIRYGVGVDARLLPWLDARASVTDMRLRMDRSALAALPLSGTLPPDPERGELRRALTLDVALGARFGAQPRSSRANAVDEGFTRLYEGRTEGLLIPVEVGVGMLQYADALGLDADALATVRAGADFGPFFGLRAVYGRSAADGLNGFGGLTAWSGEAQFNLGRVTAASPHLILGFGQLTFDDGVRDRNGVRPPDLSSVIVGAGFGIPLTDRMRAVVTARDFITTAGGLSTASSTGDLRHNLSVSAGLSVLAFGRRARPGEPRPPATITVQPAEQTTDAPSTEVSQPSAPSGGGDAAGGESPMAPGTAAAAAAEPATAGEAGAGGRERDFHSDRVVVIPIPKEGELYVRYGPVERPGAIPVPVVPAPGVPGPTTAAGEAPPSGADNRSAQGPERAGGGEGELAAELLRTIREELAALRAAAGERAARDETAALGARTDGNRSDVRREDVPEGGARAARDAEIEALQTQIRELAAIVRTLASVSTAGATTPVVATVVPGAVPFQSPPSREPFLRGAEAYVGTSSVRDGPRGIGAAMELSLGHFGPSRIRPTFGVEAARSAVRTSFGGSSVIGHVTSVGGHAGLIVDLPGLGPLLPALGVGLSGVGGGTGGSTPQDAELMDRLYGGFAMGPVVSVGGTWRGAARPRGMYLSGRIRRVWAGARSRWAVEFGLRWQRRTPTGVPVPLVPVGAAPAPVTAPPGGERMESQPAAPPPAASTHERADTIAAPEPERAMSDSTLLRRLESLEAMLQHERTQRLDEEDRLRRLEAERAAAEERARALEAERRAALERVRIIDDFLRTVGEMEGVTAVRSTDRGLEVVLGGSLFPVGSYALSPSARRSLAGLARVVASLELDDILVEGHTDATGSEEANLRLSRLRAEAVADALAAEGLDRERITVIGSGSSRPIAPNDTPEGRALNRRVEIVLRGLHTGGA